MTIIFPINDFLFELFPVENIEQLSDFLKRFYGDGPFKPEIETIELGSKNWVPDTVTSAIVYSLGSAGSIPIFTTGAIGFGAAPNPTRWD